jgi:hypothetical protein
VPSTINGSNNIEKLRLFQKGIAISIFLIIY